jgi:hypothetical protein
MLTVDQMAQIYWMCSVELFIFYKRRLTKGACAQWFFSEFFSDDLGYKT